MVRSLFSFTAVALALGLVSCVMPQAYPPAAYGNISVDPATTARIGQRIWQNECAGTVAGLTSWNQGEDFASLGIGHFIWYPRGKEGPFEESFPGLVLYFQQRGVQVPGWLLQTPDCPWNTRAEFLRDAQSPQQVQLRQLLANTVGLQTEYIIARLNRSAPKLAAAGGPAVGPNFQALSQSPEGLYAMIDYINFKGEGTKATERYNGQGWGLAQVLADMREPTPAGFAEAAKRVLSRRVANSPPARGEKRWLPGWHNRCDGYKRRL